MCGSVPTGWYVQAFNVVRPIPQQTVSTSYRDRNMNKDRIEGVVKKATGTVKEAVGKILGDGKLQSDGKTKKLEGTIQNAVGGVKDALKQ